MNSGYLLYDSEDFRGQPLCLIREFIGMNVARIKTIGLVKSRT
jgi:hypothetical protein